LPLAKGLKILEETPGLSKTLDRVIFASSLE